MSALGQKQTCAMHQPMSALPLIATAKADMYPANGQSAFSPGWLLMSALSARGGGSGIFDQKNICPVLASMCRAGGAGPSSPGVDANAARHVAFGG